MGPHWKLISKFLKTQEIHEKEIPRRRYWFTHNLPNILNYLIWSMQRNWGFPGGSAGKESAGNVGNLGSIPRLGRSPGEGKGYPPYYSVLETSMDCIVHGVTKSQTWLNKFHMQRKMLLFSHSVASGSLQI